MGKKYIKMLLVGLGILLLVVSSMIFISDYKESKEKNDSENLEIVDTVSLEGVGGETYLEGRDLLDSDKFIFRLVPYNDAPMPDERTVIVKGSDVVDDKISFTFGSIEYTEEGRYLYNIIQEDPYSSEEFIPGVTYSDSLYRVEVAVDRDSEGKLSCDYVMIRLKSNRGMLLENAEVIKDKVAVFKNVYNTDSIVWSPKGELEYIVEDFEDGELVDGAFTFSLEPSNKGNIENPVPEGAEEGYITTINFGSCFEYPGITFTKSDVGKTYLYEVGMVAPYEAEDDGYGNLFLNGVTYDRSKYIIKVEVVEVDDVLLVKATYPGYSDDRKLLFECKYSLASITLDGEVNETISGYCVLFGDEAPLENVSKVRLSPRDDVTREAIDNNDIVLSVSEVLVTGSGSGEYVDFDFGDMVFGEEGTYKFDVYQENSISDIIDYDDNVCIVTVDVQDSNKDNRLEASISYDNGSDSKADTKAIFRNYVK